MNMQTIFNKVPTFTNKLVTLAIVFVLFFGQVALAANFKSFSAPQTSISQTEDGILIIYDQKTKTETLVFDPSYTGGSTLAAYFFVVPSKPTFFEAPHTTFEELKSLVSGELPTVTPAVTPAQTTTTSTTTTTQTSTSGTSADDVLNSILGTIPASSVTPTIEQQPVVAPQPAVQTQTSTTTTVAPANSTTSEHILTSQTKSITDWLVKKNLAYSLSDLQNFSYFKTKTGSYLVAIKTTPTGTVQGITFTSPFPVLPIRLLADKAATTTTTLNVYALSENPLYVPATKILASKELAALTPKTYPSGTKSKDMDAVTAFSMKGKWLTQSNITVDPKLITADLFMSFGTNKLRVAPDSPVQIPAINVKTSKAVVPEAASIPAWDPTKSLTQAEIASDPTVHPYAKLFSAKRTLQFGLRGDDVKALQTFLRDFIDSTIKPDGKWGPKTKVAVETFQEAFSLKKDGRVGPATRGIIELIPVAEIIKRQQESVAQPAQVAAQATPIPEAAAAVQTTQTTQTTPNPVTPAPATTTTDSTGDGYSIDSLMNIIQGATSGTGDSLTETSTSGGTSGSLGSGPGGSIIGGGATQ